MSLIKFLSVIDQLIDEVYDVIPDVQEDIAIFKYKYEMMKKINPKMIPQLFQKYVLPFKKEILNKDETFFLQKDYNEFNIFKTIYTNVKNEQVKKTIWKYFQVLIILCVNI